jgi:hypothetical protein
MKAEPSLKSKYSPETKERACYKTAFIIVIYKEKHCNQKCEVGRKVGFLRSAKTRRRWRGHFGGHRQREEVGNSPGNTRIFTLAKLDRSNTKVASTLYMLHSASPVGEVLRSHRCTTPLPIKSDVGVTLFGTML